MYKDYFKQSKKSVVLLDTVEKSQTCHEMECINVTKGLLSENQKEVLHQIKN